MPATRTTSPTTVRCHWCLLRWSALWVPRQPAPGSECHQTGGIARHEALIRRRHTPGRLRVVHNPHRCRCGERRRGCGLAAALERSEGGAAGHAGRLRAHQAARPHGRARRPENPRVRKQQPTPHSNTQCPTTRRLWLQIGQLIYPKYNVLISACGMFKVCQT